MATEHGNTNPIRDLGYLAWSNDLAWMESQSGKRWDKVIRSENARFNTLRPIRDRVKRFTRDLKDLDSETEELHKYGPWSVKSAEFSPIETWMHRPTKFFVDAWDADYRSDYFAAAVPVEGGYERFDLHIYEYLEATKRMGLVERIEHCGPSVAFLNDHMIVYLKSSADHYYDSLCTYCLKARVSKTIYRLHDPTKTFNLELGRLEDGSVSLLKADFVTEELGFATENGITWVAKGSKVLAVTRHKWIVNGEQFEDYTESMSLKGGWAITLHNGIRTLWKLGATKSDKKAMVYIWGEVTYDTRDPHTLHVTDMRYRPYTIITKGNWKISQTTAHPFVCAYYNTVSPTFVIFDPIAEKKPKGLLVTAYGAYGFPTKIGRLVQRWRPLLNAGWIIASVAVPGSGDHDLAWRFQGQRANRKVAVDTLCAAIKDLQEEFCVDASKTALYGRSAGGLLVSAVLNVAPGLVSALYMESPYVDALRTMTNPKYPLTVLESKEFGAGENPTDVVSLGSWSPMEHIPAEGYPGVFVIARTDMADLEVYPYEILKYISRVRGSLEQGRAQAKLVYVTKDRGHFTTDRETRAEDLALLDHWAENSNKNLGYKYKMPNNNTGMRNKNKNKNKNKTVNKNKNKTVNKNKNKNKTRKNRKDRKDRKDRK